MNGTKSIVVGLLVIVAAFLYGGRRSALLIHVRKFLTGEQGCAPIRYDIGNVTLHYFASRGRAEAIRLIMEETNTPYVETGFTKETWPAAKEEGLKSGLFPFGLGITFSCVICTHYTTLTKRIEREIKVCGKLNIVL
jgi:hypothetical protein